jgi:hypothetical protein
VTGNETACKMGVSRCFVKSPSTQSVLTNESGKTHSNRRCWHFCCHFCWHNSTLKIRAESRHRSVRSIQQASADVVSVVFTGLCHAPLVAPRNLAPAGEDDSRVFAPAVTRLLMLRCPAARAQAVRFVRSGPALSGGGEESSPAPSERNAKHEHDREPHLHRMPRNRSAAHESNRQADQNPSSTAGMENCFTPRMSHTRHHATVRNSGPGGRLLEEAHRESS